ncbi:UNVERIFIED_CONTAM: pan3 [Trichonephila clavipes]
MKVNIFHSQNTLLSPTWNCIFNSKKNLVISSEKSYDIPSLKSDRLIWFSNNLNLIIAFLYHMLDCIVINYVSFIYYDKNIYYLLHLLYSTSHKCMSNLRQHAGLLPESLIWGYIVQLSSVLRTIHAAGLACRAFDPSKILVTGKSRQELNFLMLRLNCCGIFDVLTYDPNQHNPKQVASHFQQEDLMAFGKIVLALACNTLTAVKRNNMTSSLELVSRNYSADLRNLILYLLHHQTRPRSINDIMPMIGARFYTQLDAAQMRSDVIENELSKEVQNGRLFRLLVKLGTITERPE